MLKFLKRTLNILIFYQSSSDFFFQITSKIPLTLVNDEFRFQNFYRIMEKPPFILLYRYKKKNQKSTVTEIALYTPAVHLDYVYADTLYSWNKKDVQYLNRNGGEYKNLSSWVI